MTKYHLKRKMAPKTWPVVKKETKFIMRPRPKGHELEFTLPVTVVMREMLGVAKDVRQVRAILREQEVKVNGSRIHQADSPVAFMDILSIGKDLYRMILNENGTLHMLPVKKGEEFTLQKIRDKTHVKGGKMQLNLLGGVNVLIDKDTYKAGDTVALKDGKITAHYPLEVGATAFVTGGTHIGKSGVIQSFDNETKTVVVKVGKEDLRTAKEYAYAIGKDKPAITLK